MRCLKSFCQITCVAFLSVFIHPAKAQIIRINNINCKLSAGDLALLNKMGTYEARFYNHVFSTYKNDSVTVDINLYGKYSEYKQVQKDEIHTTFIDGFYSGRQNKIFIYKSNNYMNTLIHETSHNILRYNFPNPPKWLNEGIATLLGYLAETPEGQIGYVAQGGYIRKVRDSIKAGLFNLDNFFNYKDTDWFNKDKRDMLYSASYCIVYLMTKLDKDYLGQVLVLMKQGHSTQDAIKTVFGSMDKFKELFNFFYTVSVGPHF